MTTKLLPLFFYGPSTENEPSTPISEDVSTHSPSTVPTEIDDLESQEIMIQVQCTGIKIRDFPYGPPYVSPSISASTGDATGSADSKSSTIVLNTVTLGIALPKRTTEIFVPCDAPTEIDYREHKADR